MIKNIVFDMGNVLVQYDPECFLKDYSDEEKDLFIKEIYLSPEWLSLDRGELTEDELIKRICINIPKRLHDDVYKLVRWYELTEPIKGMISLTRILRKNGYRIYLLSNTSLAFHQFRQGISALKAFTGEFISADCGILKPDKRIFRLFCDKFGLIPDECVFIDDSEANVESARELGFDAIVFTGNAGQLKKKLKEKNIL